MSIGPHSRKKVCYYYDSEVGNFNYGRNHPMQPKRIRMTHELVLEYELRRKMIILRPPRAQGSEMSQFHDKDYVNFLENVNLTKPTAKKKSMMVDYLGKEGDCPVFDGLYDFCQISAGGSVAGAKKLNSGEADIAINWAGGLHHARASKASGFCYVNDIVLAIMELLKHHQRVLYLDIDIHHGDGVELAFKESDQVMTVSFHLYNEKYEKSGRKFKSFFPGTGKVSDIGDNAGKYYAVNVPLKEGITDQAYESVFVPIMTKVMESYQPSAIVLQCGADSLNGDLIGRFNLTLKGHGKCVEFMRKQNLPLLLLGGGGYTVENVARCWTYETGLAVGTELEDEFPFPYDDYFPKDFGELPFNLYIDADSEMINENSLEYLQEITAAVLENLRQLPCAPGVPLREIEDTLSDMSVDDEEDEDCDQRNSSTALDRRLPKDNEFSDSEDEDESGRRDHNEDNASKRLNKDPPEDLNERRKWFLGVMSLLRRSKDDSELFEQLEYSLLKPSTGLFHELVSVLKEVDELNLLMHVDDYGNRIIFHKILQLMEVEERTLDILSDAGLNFNVLDSFHQNSLHAAIYGHRSVSLLKNLIQRGANVKQVDSNGDNLIHYAAAHTWKPEVLEFLISEGVDVNAPNRNDERPLAKLQKMSFPERVLALFKVFANAGASSYRQTILHEFFESYKGINKLFRELVEFITSEGKIKWFNTKRYDDGCTPLHLALNLHEINEELLQMLQNARVDFTQVDYKGRGCLYYAIAGKQKKNLQLLQSLIDKGADVFEETTFGETLLHTAVEERAPWETFEVLLKNGVQIYKQDKLEYTALGKAINKSYSRYSNDRDILTKLFILNFDSGIRHAKVKFNTMSLLHAAIKYGTLEVVKHMLENGGDVNEVDSEGKTPFLNATEGDFADGVEKAKLLRRFGAHIPLEGRQKVLHTVAMAGTLETLKYCIDELEVSVDDKLTDFKTPMHSILFDPNFSNNQLMKAKTLIVEGADVNAKPSPNVFVDDIMKLQTPLHLALYRYNISIDASEFKNFLIQLLEKGADLNESSLTGWTALHILMNNTVKDSLELAKLLVHYGADIQAKTHQLQSVLHIAAKGRDIEKIRFCLEKGLNVNDLDNDGKTPLEIFLPSENDYVRNDYEKNALINGMKMLLENGATAETKEILKNEIQTRLQNIRIGSCDRLSSVFREFLLILN